MKLLLTKISWLLAFSGVSSRYMPTRCRANLLSFCSSIRSSTRYTRSNLDRSVGGKSMFCGTGKFGLYLLPIGFAEASILVRAFRVVMIPALAIETVCCSMTSWSTDLVESDILSNSSMQHTPPSDNTRAPDSRTSCRLSGSRVTYAVSPTAEDPLPLV